jgi:hypothetical protein
LYYSDLFLGMKFWFLVSFPRISTLSHLYRIHELSLCTQFYYLIFMQHGRILSFHRVRLQINLVTDD